MTAIDWTKYPEPWNEIGPAFARDATMICGKKIEPPPLRFGKWSPEEKRLADELHAQGVSYGKIAKALSRTRGAVGARFYRDGSGLGLASPPSQIPEPA
jgi:hypothetical protein